jgi:hypothetical protein
MEFPKIQMTEATLRQEALRQAINSVDGAVPTDDIIKRAEAFAKFLSADGQQSS